MSAASFDLIYVIKGTDKTMSCAIVDGLTSELVGPFPAKEAGPKIVAALLERQAFDFKSKDEAELAYATCHFRNMNNGVNAAGQDYPYRI